MTLTINSLSLLRNNSLCPRFSLLPGALCIIGGANGIGKSATLNAIRMPLQDFDIKYSIKIPNHLSNSLILNPDILDVDTSIDDSSSLIITLSGDSIEYRAQICHIPSLPDNMSGFFTARNTVLEHLRRLAKHHGTEDALNAALHALSLNVVGNNRISDLSIGWKKRLQLSELFLSIGAIWLLDNPFCLLDSDAIDIMMNAIQVRCMTDGIVLIAASDAERRIIMEKIAKNDDSIDASDHSNIFGPTNIVDVNLEHLIDRTRL